MIFCTGNAAKFATADEIFREHGLGLRQREADLTEVQADNSLQIAQSKAAQASRLFQPPFFVEDSSFHVPALGGFPGVYAKYVLNTIGVHGILAIMHGVADRQCYFESSIVLIDHDGHEHVFRHQRAGLRVSEQTLPVSYGWSSLWSVIVVEDLGKHVAELTEQEFRLKDAQWRETSNLTQLARHLSARQVH